MKLEKPPRIVVYSPKINQPWDDAVTLVLTYAEIPYDRVYDQEVLEGKLPSYDWLHLHHETLQASTANLCGTATRHGSRHSNRNPKDWQ
jgi:hypothetical protein